MPLIKHVAYKYQLSTIHFYIISLIDTQKRDPIGAQEKGVHDIFGWQDGVQYFNKAY